MRINYTPQITLICVQFLILVIPSFLTDYVSAEKSKGKDLNLPTRIDMDKEFDRELDVIVVFRLSVIKDKLYSTEHVICANYSFKSADLVEEDKCELRQGRLVHRLFRISTRHALGVQPVIKKKSIESSLLACLNFFPELPDSVLEDDTNNETEGILGLSVGSPCAGSRRSSFILDVFSRTLIQRVKPAKTLLTPPAPFTCVFHQVNQALLPSNVGGLIFPVILYFCKARVSNVVSEIDGNIIVGTLTAVISTSVAVTSVMLPREVLRAISGWILATPDSNHSLYDANSCSFITSANETNPYGVPSEYLSCKIHPDVAKNLPRLELHVQTCRSDNISQISKYRPAIIYINFTSLMDKNGELKIRSSGSLTEAMQSRDGTKQLPRIVIGALFLRDATITLTRNPQGEPAFIGSPLMIINFYSLHEAETKVQIKQVHNGTDAPSCAVPKSCAPEEKLFTTLNRCGTLPDCRRLIIYNYNPNTLRCEPNLNFLTVLVVLACLLIVTDLAVIILRRYVENMTRRAADEMLVQKTK